MRTLRYVVIAAVLLGLASPAAALPFRFRFAIDTTGANSDGIYLDAIISGFFDYESTTSGVSMPDRPGETVYTGGLLDFALLVNAKGVDVGPIIEERLTIGNGPDRPFGEDIVAVFIRTATTDISIFAVFEETEFDNTGIQGSLSLSGLEFLYFNAGGPGADDFVSATIVPRPLSSFTSHPIPEPAGFVVFAIGAGVVGLARHRRSRKN